MVIKKAIIYADQTFIETCHPYHF